MKYQVTSPAFNFGPIPCTPGDFSYSETLDNPEFIDGSGVDCSGNYSRWEPTNNEKTYPRLVGFFRSDVYLGLFQGYEINGGLGYRFSNGKYTGGTPNHSAWFYVR